MARRLSRSWSVGGMYGDRTRQGIVFKNSSGERSPLSFANGPARFANATSVVQVYAVERHNPLTAESGFTSLPIHLVDVLSCHRLRVQVDLEVFQPSGTFPVLELQLALN